MEESVGTGPILPPQDAPLLSLDEAETRKLFSDFDTLLLRKGACIVMCGEVLKDLFIVKCGTVSAEYRLRKRRARVTLGAGEFFGECAALREEPSDATVRAAEDNTLVLRVCLSEFKRALETVPGLRQDFLERSARRLILVDRAAARTTQY